MTVHVLQEPPTTSAKFAAFATTLSYDDLPPATVHRVQLHLLDTLGAAVAGSESKEAATSRAMTRTVGGFNSDPSYATTVWGTPYRAAPLSAAFLNGIAAHAFELDDSGGCDHSGAVVVPAALAAAGFAEQPVTGKRLLTAIALGYELGRRVQTAMGGYDAVNDRGWHSTGVCGTFAAAAAVGHVLSLNAHQMTDAIGLAGAFTGGTWAFMEDSAMSKRLHVGRAAEAGLNSAALAKAGFNGPAAIFDARWGNVLGLYGGPNPDPTAIFDQLGATWEVERASIKPYAFCRSTHSAIDTAIELHRTGTNGADVQRVEIHTSALIADMCGSSELGTLVSAQLSMPYALALALARGSASLNDVLTGRNDPDVLALMHRVRIVTDPQQHGGSAEPRIVVHTDIVTHTRQCGRPRGGWDNRLSDQETIAKFHQLTAPRVGDHHSEQIASAVTNLPDLQTVSGLLEGLATQQEPSLVT